MSAAKKTCPQASVTALARPGPTPGVPPDDRGRFAVRLRT